MTRTRRRERAIVAVGALLASLLLACVPPAFALNPALDVTQYVHNAWRIREGFTKGSITSFAQTADGYIWLGTEFGLLRFDGVRTVPWQPPQGQSLPSTYIMALLAANDGTLWIATLDGVVSWKSGALTVYPELAGIYVSKFLEDRSGAIWLAGQTIGKLTGRLCSIRSGAIQCDGADGSLGIGVGELYQDGEGSLWVGTSLGFWRWAPGPRQFFAVPGQPNGIRGVAEDDDGALVVPTRGTIRFFAHGAEMPSRQTPARARPYQVTRMLRDRDGGLWIGTSGGGVVHLHQGRMDVFGPSDGLSSDGAHALFEDREGNVWVATSDGLDRFREPAVATFAVAQGLSSANITSVLAARDGSVWLGSSEGLNRWRDGHNTIYHDHRTLAAIAPSDGADNVREIVGPGLPAHGVHSLAQDHLGRVWVSTRDGVGFIDHDRFTPISGLPAGENVNFVAEDSGGTVWVANFDGSLFEIVEGGVAQRVPPATLGHTDPVSVIAADPVRGGVWLGFARGGIAYFTGGQVRESYGGADGLGAGRVTSFQLDRDGTLWAATAHGLSVVKGGRVTTLAARQGLPCDTVHWAIEDDARMFWLFTTCGLVRVARDDLEGGRVRRTTVYDNGDGVRLEASIGSYNPLVSKSADGRIWFRTVVGVSVIDPRRLPLNSIPPPVHVERIAADRTNYDAGSTGPTPVRLPALTRDLQIDYTALSFVAPEKVRFRYTLEGFDRDWQDVGNRRQAFYTNLPPGSYRFRVSASNNSGVWNDAGAALDLSIAPAYYQTAWFRAAAAFGVMALLWMLYQYRLRLVAHEFDARLQERVNERTRIARELHDTLLQGFHGLLFRFQAVSNMLPARPVEAKQQLDGAIDQVAQAITEGRDAVQNLRASTTITNDLAEAISTLAAELGAAAVTDSNASPAVVDVEVEGTPRHLRPILRDDVYRIAGEALRNALRYAHARRIEVELRYDERQLQVRVRDDGRGIDPAVRDDRRPGHFGLPGMRERAELAGGHLEVWSEVGLGTEVEVTIPAAAAYAVPRARGRFWVFASRVGTNP
ncbi:MAG TPA: two-component regulator propeller domain-containing protein [Vicinamibacterales bacterium]|nr:two-component regulator propeller domain-containing protein [Vicinamibacterales bacterium]